MEPPWSLLFAKAFTGKGHVVVTMVAPLFVTAFGLVTAASETSQMPLELLLFVACAQPRVRFYGKITDRAALTPTATTVQT